MIPPWHLGKSKQKTFWEGFTTVDAIKNTCDSGEEVKIPTLTGVWKKLIPTLMDDFEGFKTSEENTSVDDVILYTENPKYYTKKNS